MESLRGIEAKDKGKKKLESQNGKQGNSPSLPSPSSRLNRASTLVLQSSLVAAGTIDSLVDHLTDVYSVAGKALPPHGATTTHSILITGTEYAERFLFTYRYFMSGQDLLDELKRRYLIKRVIVFMLLLDFDRGYIYKSPF